MFGTPVAKDSAAPTSSTTPAASAASQLFSQSSLQLRFSHALLNHYLAPFSFTLGILRAAGASLTMLESWPGLTPLEERRSPRLGLIRIPSGPSPHNK